MTVANVNELSASSGIKIFIISAFNLFIVLFVYTYSYPVFMFAVIRCADSQYVQITTFLLCFLCAITSNKVNPFLANACDLC